MISINDLTLSYPGGIPVIENLNLTLSTGQIHGLVGLNGTGKTSLLNVIHGMLIPQSGAILIDGRQLTKKDIGFLPTENYFYPNITGREYLQLFANPNFDADHWNDIFSLPLDQTIDGYSTGMKKKLAILGVLKADKPILILDEPFNGLDIETGRTLHSIISILKSKQKTIVVTSHILDSLMDLCDEIHYLESGIIKKSLQKEHFESFKTELYESMANKTKQKLDTLL
ncbi:MAG: ATP-binding cassette domain-containing protein [Reichenbachiella sp.]|uniref:ABC transporter ATP-binding protein n=1 Tax=Reichenbachiella sp. TaxID=2184521 RepID=UPI00326342AF